MEMGLRHWRSAHSSSVVAACTYTGAEGRNQDGFPDQRQFTLNPSKAARALSTSASHHAQVQAQGRQPVGQVLFPELGRDQQTGQGDHGRVKAQVHV